MHGPRSTCGNLAALIFLSISYDSISATNQNAHVLLYAPQFYALKLRVPPERMATHLLSIACISWDSSITVSMHRRFCGNKGV
jgi:hypothetical protein